MTLSIEELGIRAILISCTWQLSIQTTQLSPFVHNQGEIVWTCCYWEIQVHFGVWTRILTTAIQCVAIELRRPCTACMFRRGVVMRITEFTSGFPTFNDLTSKNHLSIKQSTIHRNKVIMSYRVQLKYHYIYNSLSLLTFMKLKFFLKNQYRLTDIPGDLYTRWIAHWGHLKPARMNIFYVNLISQFALKTARRTKLDKEKMQNTYVIDKNFIIFNPSESL